jgi:hypothetical protein
MALRLSKEELLHSVSFGYEIAALLTGGGHVRSDRDNWLFPTGLSVHKSLGLWCDLKAVRNGRPVGGRSMVALWCHRKGCTEAEAVQAIKLFLKAHPGFGRITGEQVEDDGESGSLDEPHNAALDAMAHELQGLRQPIESTPGEAWVRGRLPGYGAFNFEDIAWVPPGLLSGADGAVLFTLRCLGTVVGYECHLIDPVRAERTAIKKNRLMYWLDRGRRQGPVTFADLPPPVAQNGPITVGFTEGWFDQESARLSKLKLPVIGVPGVHWLKRLEVPRGSTVYLFSDGDALDSPAHQQLIGAADHFLMQDAKVFITDPRGPNG